MDSSLSIPSSSLPRPVPTLQDKASADLLEILHGDLSNSSLGLDSDEDWVPLISNFCHYYLSKLPSPQGWQWDLLHEKIKLIELILSVVSRAISSKSSLFIGHDSGAKLLFTTLVCLHYVLDQWCAANVPQSDAVVSPQTLRENVLDAIFELLQSLGNGDKAGEDKVTTWVTLGSILSKCLGICDDYLSSIIKPNLPWKIHLFGVQNKGSDSAVFDAEGTIPDSVIIRKPSQLPLFLSFLSTVVLRTLSPPMLCQDLLVHHIRRAVSISSDLCDHFLSSSCSSPSTERIKAISRILQAIQPFCREGSGVENASRAIQSRVILYRLEHNSQGGWDHFDAAFQEYVMGPVCTATDLVPVIDSILSEELPDTFQDAAISYISKCTWTYDEETLQALEVRLNQLRGNPRTTTGGLGRVLEAIRHTASEVPDVKPAHGRVQWMSRVRALVERIIAPGSVDWMEDDTSMSKNSYMTRALSEVRGRFESKLLYKPLEQGRVELAKDVGTLACCLVHPEAECSPEFTPKHGYVILTTCSQVLEMLLEGPSGKEVTPTVHQVVMENLRQCLKHHQSGLSASALSTSHSICAKGLVDGRRHIRLAAGHVATELIRLYQTNENDKASELMDSVLRGLRRLDTHKETTLLVLGHIAKIAVGRVLGRAICSIFSQIGKPNHAIRGTAYLQLMQLAKYYKKSHYDFLSPYMDQIVDYTMSRVNSEPTLLIELCRFLSLGVPEFIRHTLSEALPKFIIQRNRPVLNYIENTLGERIYVLVLGLAAELLAGIFLLQDSNAIDEALDFTLGLLNENPGQQRITLESFILSYSVPLLTELVIAMHNGNPEIQSLVIDGFRRVQVATSQSPSRKTRPPNQEVATKEFVTANMLAIMMRLSESLHDMYGKKSVETKRQIIGGIAPFISYVGNAISGIGLQTMALLQTTLGSPPLVSVTLDTWKVFLQTLQPSDLGLYIGVTSAAFLASWEQISRDERAVAKECLEYIVIECSDKLGSHLDEIADLRRHQELQTANTRLLELRSDETPEKQLRRILNRTSNENYAVACQAMEELKSFMLSKHSGFIHDLASGDAFSPLVSEIVSKLMAAAARDDDNAELLRLLAYHCLGIFGAVDPDRFELPSGDENAALFSNFNDENDAVAFALYLISDVLVGVFRSASDLNYQTQVAYVIQELLKFCKFTPNILSSAPPSSVTLKVRRRWEMLPKHVVETVAPFLESKYHKKNQLEIRDSGIVYLVQPTYREWIQQWTAYLLDKAVGTHVNAIFPLFHWIIVHKDASIAHRLLPHLVLNLMIFGPEEEVELIRVEILTVLQDQVNPDGKSTNDKRFLSTQAIFMLMDHLNKWVRLVRQEATGKKPDGGTRRGRSHGGDEMEQRLQRVDSILSSIPRELVARAALQCKAFARSLMSFEGQVFDLKANDATEADLQPYYEHLHEIYANLDEPDGMEGISTLVLLPSLEHKIRQHESTGRWTSAQSCWEVKLQNNPDNLDYHIGLLRCLRNLGHYDTLRTHVKGVLTRNPEWEPALIGFQVESAWMVGDWQEVQTCVDRTETDTSHTVIARVLLAYHNGEPPTAALASARKFLGAPVTAVGARGYRGCYQSVLDLHMLQEVDLISSVSTGPPPRPLRELSGALAARFEATLPAFRVREPILSMRRTAFGINGSQEGDDDNIIGLTWLDSSKIARKAGHWQTAYSAMLQAQRRAAPYWFLESAKLMKAMGEPLRALQELEHALRSSSHADDQENRKSKAKALVTRARWMNESERYQPTEVLKAFQAGAEILTMWESGHFHLGHFQDECFKMLPQADLRTRGSRMNLNTIRFYSKAIKAGSKYVYQTVPRLLTLWLDLGEDDPDLKTESNQKINQEVSKAIEAIPTYKWFPAFPQIASRVGHGSNEVYKLLASLISRIIGEYPKQALWLFISVVKSTKQIRAARGKKLLDRLKLDPRYRDTEVPGLIDDSLTMTNELLGLCDYPIKDDRKTLNMQKHFPNLFKLAPSRVIIPLQESLIANFPPTSSSETTHQPFPIDAPTFEFLYDEIEVMRSLARPRKISISGSNGQSYVFLGKPKDDLRKDARLMDFNGIINKLLKANSESRRRKLYIRTYGVVTLNEECGFIQWVSYTVPVRNVLVKLYEQRGISGGWNTELAHAFGRIKGAESPREIAEIFQTDILKQFPPVFHIWFLETFPEPSMWLSSRLAYSRTAAVMSIIGFILGLGDRHLENILMDSHTGDAVHVDFNCLFEKGKTLETPERVPFRLTHNIVDALGVTGPEGLFRIACEITLQILRTNKDCLMSVLDAFIHDPLMEWEDEKRRLDRKSKHGNNNNVRALTDLKVLAKNALDPIGKKLRGIYASNGKGHLKEITTSNLVQMVIQEATDPANLGRMYPGWAPHL